MKYAVISSDANKDYLFLLPLTCFSWMRLEYTPVIILINVPANNVELLRKNCFGATIICEEGEEDIKSSTIAQVARLMVHRDAMFNNDDIIIIGDADMLQVKNIFQHGGVVSYGYDLTGRSEIPMCYFRAHVSEWKKIIGETKIEDLPKAYSEKWEDYWSVDQQLLTTKAKEYGFEKITFVDRGHGSHGLPTGRWDRHCWDKVPDEIIDVHMLRSPLHEERWPLVKDMVKRLWPDDNWEWLEEYKKEFENI